MIVDHPSSAPPLLMVGKRERATKTEMKMTLVAQRLSMLEDKENTELHVTCSTPTKYERTKRLREISAESTHKRPKHSSDLNTSVLKRAEEAREKLPENHASFSKLMLRSHVTYGFWLGLPSKFCVRHLPKRDEKVVLIDEDDIKFDTKFLVEKCGLSAGWRAFSVHHNLREGDAVVFLLVEPTTFKVYIVRANDLAEIDGAVSLLNLDACRGERQLDYAEKDEDLGSEMHDGVMLSESSTSFEQVQGFESFIIEVGGLIIDSKISQHHRRKYYDLCCTQKSFLHENLLKGLNCDLIVGIIAETTNIADAIKLASNGSSGLVSRDDLHVWERTLEGFEILGMNVAFLRAQLCEILGSSTESPKTGGSERYEEGQVEQSRAGERQEPERVGSEQCEEGRVEETRLVGERMEALELKLIELKVQMNRIGEEMEDLKRTWQNRGHNKTNV